MRRALSSLFTLLYFTTNVALSHAVETNLWEQRRRSFSPAVATLPADLPEIAAPSLEKRVAMTRRLDMSSYGAIPADISDALSAIPVNAGTVVELTGPSRETSGKAQPWVIVIQDVHMNSEAQSNIARTVTSIADAVRAHEDHRLVVGVEAAFEPFEFSRLRSLPNKHVLDSVARYALETYRIAAPSFVGLSSLSNPPIFTGIDDRDHYTANVKTYQDSVQLKEQAQAQWLRSKELLAKRKISLNPSLKSFDAQREAYGNGSTGLGTYLTSLMHLAESLPTARRPGIDPTLRNFSDALALEKTLNFARVEQERVHVLENLIRSMNKAQLTELTNRGLAFRAGRLTFGDYYRELRRMLEQNSISLKAAPSFAKYLQYAALSDSIKAAPVFAALRRLEDSLVDRLALNQNEKEVMRQAHLLGLQRRLLNFDLTPEEWQEYKLTQGRDPQFSAFERFYEEADIRSGFMVENLLRAGNQTLSSLIVGGFHTPMVTALLRKRGIGFAVIQPVITKLDDQASGYLSLFTRKKSPLDQLFSGRSLFLGISAQQVGTQEAPAATGFIEHLALAESLGENDKLTTPFGEATKQGPLIRTTTETGDVTFTTANTVPANFDAVGEPLAPTDLTALQTLKPRVGLPKIPSSAPKIIFWIAVGTGLMSLLLVAYLNWAPKNAGALAGAAFVSPGLIEWLKARFRRAAPAEPSVPPIATSPPSPTVKESKPEPQIRPTPTPALLGTGEISTEEFAPSPEAINEMSELIDLSNSALPKDRLPYLRPTQFELAKNHMLGVIAAENEKSEKIEIRRRQNETAPAGSPTAVDREAFLNRIRDWSEIGLLDEATDAFNRTYIPIQSRAEILISMKEPQNDSTNRDEIVSNSQANNELKHRASLDDLEYVLQGFVRRSAHYRELISAHGDDPESELVRAWHRGVAEFYLGRLAEGGSAQQGQADLQFYYDTWRITDKLGMPHPMFYELCIYAMNEGWNIGEFYRWFHSLNLAAQWPRKFSRPWFVKFYDEALDKRRVRSGPKTAAGVDFFKFMMPARGSKNGISEKRLRKSITNFVTEMERWPGHRQNAAQEARKRRLAVRAQNFGIPETLFEAMYVAVGSDDPAAFLKLEDWIIELEEAGRQLWGNESKDLIERWFSAFEKTHKKRVEQGSEQGEPAEVLVRFLEGNGTVKLIGNLSDYIARKTRPDSLPPANGALLLLAMFSPTGNPNLIAVAAIAIIAAVWFAWHTYKRSKFESLRNNKLAFWAARAQPSANSLGLSEFGLAGHELIRTITPANAPRRLAILDKISADDRSRPLESLFSGQIHSPGFHVELLGNDADLAVRHLLRIARSGGLDRDNILFAMASDERVVARLQREVNENPLFHGSSIVVRKYDERTSLTLSLLKTWATEEKASRQLGAEISPTNVNILVDADAFLPTALLESLEKIQNEQGGPLVQLFFLLLTLDKVVPTTVNALKDLPRLEQLYASQA